MAAAEEIDGAPRALRTGNLAVPLRFSREEAERFAAAGGDHNPLYTSEDVARKTPYGERPVSGVLAVLRVLEAIAPAGDSRVASLKVRFQRPLFAGRDYEVQGTISPEGGVDVRIVGASGTSYAKLSARLSPSSSTVAEESRATLLGISHVLGTASAGRAALLTSFELTATDGPDAREVGRPPEVHVEADPRFDLLQISATWPGVSLSVQAVCLPPPVSLRWEDARDVGATVDVSGKSVLVTGASRGFGLAMALTASRSSLSAHGVVREASGPLASLERAAAADRRRLAFHPVDLAAPGCGARLLAALRPATPTLDFLILSASGPIQEIPLLDQPEGYCSAFVRSSLDLITGPLRSALPLLRPQATVVLVSSVYVESPPKNLAHYVAAKVAAESVLRSFAAELPACRFVVARAPKMLTDQTNVGSARGGPLPSAFDVASSLWRALLHLRWDGADNFRLLGAL